MEAIVIVNVNFTDAPAVDQWQQYGTGVPPPYSSRSIKTTDVIETYTFNANCFFAICSFQPPLSDYNSLPIHFAMTHSHRL